MYALRLVKTLHLFSAELVITGYVQTEQMTCCLGRKHQNLVLFWKIFNSYVCFSVDNDTINNSESYFACGDCNLKNIVTKL